MKLQNLKVSVRLMLVILVSLIGYIAIVVSSAIDLRHSLLDDHRVRITDIVDSTKAVFAHYQELEKSGQLSREEAQRGAKEQLRRVRFGDNDYLFIYDANATTILSPVKPETEGKSLAGKTSPDGFPVFDTVAQVARSGKSTFMEYTWPRIGAQEPSPKLSYVAAVPEWGWGYGTGVYVDDVDAAFRAFLARSLAVTAVAIAAVVLLSWLVVRSVLVQLGGEPSYAVDVMRRVAQGRLDEEVIAPDSGGSLLGATREMVGSLRGMLREIGGNAQEVAQHAQRIARASREVADSAHQQSDATSSIAAAVEQMTVSINHIADSARDTEHNSSKAASLAVEGEQRAGTAMDEMRRIATTVEEAAGQIQVLVSRSNEIGSIANVIKDIAAQTNLLALNAAIEAARAGEQGRGFAVVADEVRSLAERTSNATVQIEQMIQGIQGETHGAVAAMGDVANRVENGVSMVEGAAGSLREISAGTDVALGRIREVAEATTEQSSASNAIARQVEQIAQMVEGTSAAMKTSVDSVDELERLAARLHEMVGRFRT